MFCSKEEDDDEELIPLSHPPTLSITEEILEFINQSRAREGLAAIPTGTAVRWLADDSFTDTLLSNESCFNTAVVPVFPGEEPR